MRREQMAIRYIYLFRSHVYVLPPVLGALLANAVGVDFFNFVFLRKRIPVRVFNRPVPHPGSWSRA
jgi:hypothetical protein